MANNQQNNNGNIALGIGGATALGGIGAHYLANNIKERAKKVEDSFNKKDLKAKRLRFRKDMAERTQLYFADKKGEEFDHVHKLFKARVYRKKGKNLTKGLEESFEKGDLKKGREYYTKLKELHKDILNDKSLKGKKFMKKKSLAKNGLFWKHPEGEISYVDLFNKQTDRLPRMGRKLVIAYGHRNKYKRILEDLNKKEKMLRLGGKAALGLGAGAMLAGAYNKLKGN